MKTNTLALAITLTIGVILTGALLVPVLNSTTEVERTFTNEGYYTMDAVTDSTVRVIEWDKSTPDTITIDGEPFDMSFVTVNNSYTLIGSDSTILRYINVSTAKGVMIFSNDSNAAYVSFNTGSAEAAGTKATITLENNSLSFVTDGTTPINKTVSDIGNDAFAINPDATGEYVVVMKQSNVPAYVLGDSTIRFMGISVASGPGGIGIYGVGNLTDGMELTTIYTNNTTTDVTYSSPTPTDAKVNGFNNLYTLDKYTFTISYSDDGTPKTYDATYSYFLVPAEVTAEKSQHLDSGEIAILNALPILVIVALLMVAVGAIAYRRAD